MLHSDDDSFLKSLPVRKQRKLPAADKAVLTRHFKIASQVKPVNTGGKVVFSKDGVSAWGLNDFKVCHFSLAGAEIQTIFEENEEVLTFALSPNEQLLATTNKTYMTRVYQVGQSSD